MFYANHSSFAPRKVTCDAHSYYTTAAVVDRAFAIDWSRCNSERFRHFVAGFDDDGLRGVDIELAELREAGEFLRVGTVGGAVLAVELREARRAQHVAGAVIGRLLRLERALHLNGIYWHGRPIGVKSDNYLVPTLTNFIKIFTNLTGILQSLTSARDFRKKDVIALFLLLLFQKTYSYEK